MLKTVSSITNAIGALNYKGTWNANANTPALASGVGTKGDYYVVSVAGSTTLDGISNWGVGDWATFNGSVWQRVEGGADLNGVNLNVSGTSTLGAATTTNINTGSGIVTGATSGIASTLFSASGDGLYFVTAYLINDAAAYIATAIVSSSGAAYVITPTNAMLMTLTMSGANVQATQASGANQNIYFSYLKIK